MNSWAKHKTFTRFRQKRSGGAELLVFQTCNQRIASQWWVQVCQWPYVMSLGKKLYIHWRLCFDIYKLGRGRLDLATHKISKRLTFWILTRLFEDFYLCRLYKCKWQMGWNLSNKFKKKRSTQVTVLWIFLCNVELNN